MEIISKVGLVYLINERNENTSHLSNDFFGWINDVKVDGFID